MKEKIFQTVKILQRIIDTGNKRRPRGVRNPPPGGRSTRVGTMHLPFPKTETRFAGQSGASLPP